MKIRKRNGAVQYADVVLELRGCCLGFQRVRVSFAARLLYKYVPGPAGANWQIRVIASERNHGVQFMLGEGFPGGCEGKMMSATGGEAAVTKLRMRTCGLG